MSEQQSNASPVYEPAPRLVQLAPWLIGIVGLAASLLLAWSLRSNERERMRAAFDLQASQAIANVRLDLLQMEGQLFQVKSFFDSSEVVELGEFSTFTRHGLGRNDGLRALLWIESGEAGEEVKYSVGPEGASERVRRGLLDLPQVRELLKRCRDAAAPMASAPIVDFVPGALPRVLVAVPVQQGGAAFGYVAALLDLERVLENAGVVHSSWNFMVDDVGPVVGELEAEPVRLAGFEVPGGLRRVEPEAWWGRRWQLMAAAAEGSFQGMLTSWPLIALADGTILTALLVGIVATGMNRRRLKWLVDRRTQDIKATYDTLAEESERRIEYMMEARALEQQMREIVDLVPYQIYVKDWYGRFLLANEATAKALGTTVKELTATSSVDLDHDVLTPGEKLLEERSLMEHDQSAVNHAVPVDMPDGRRRLMREIKAPFRGLPGGRKALLCVAMDVTEQHHVTLTLAAQNRLLEALAKGASSERVLRDVVGAAEEIVPGMRASILRVAPDGKHLLHAHAPSLPAFYNEAVDGIEIGPMMGSCGAAAHTAELVVVEDVMAHPNWAPYRETAKQAGIRACWSQPILSKENEALGTFAMYYSEVRRPEEYELAFMRAMAHLAMVAIEHSHAEKEA